METVYANKNISPFILISSVISVVLTLVYQHLHFSLITTVTTLCAIAISNILWFVKFDHDTKFTRTNELIFLPQLFVMFLVGIYI